MNPEEVLQFLRRQPFEPFRIFLTDGTTYDVRHPDQCIVTRTAVHVALPAGNRAYARGIAAYALVHINRLEPLGELAEQSEHGAP
jgi:hypothetical protein